MFTLFYLGISLCPYGKVFIPSERIYHHNKIKMFYYFRMYTYIFYDLKI